jgi:hypothetical protein
MYKHTFIFIVFLLLNCENAYSQDFTIEKNIAFLSNDSLQGRLVGSPSEKIAATYIAQVFEHYNLIPALDNSYFQNFNFTYHSKPHDTLIIIQYEQSF